MELEIIEKQNLLDYLKYISYLNDDKTEFEISISVVTIFNDGQHFFQLFGSFEDEPENKFCISLQTKCRDYIVNGDNSKNTFIETFAIRAKHFKFDENGVNFPKFLNKIYNLNWDDEFMMADMTTFEVIPLNLNKITLEDVFSKKIELKLVNKKFNFEIYFNLDLPRKCVQFKEVNQKYRLNFLEAITKKKIQKKISKSAEFDKKWLGYIKSISKTDSWKCKSNFNYKKINNLLFNANFSTNPKTNSITCYLGVKLYNIDDLYWKTSLDNKKISDHPESLRVNGSHQVRSIQILNISINDVNEKSLDELLHTINNNVEVFSNSLNNEDKYIEFVYQKLKDKNTISTHQLHLNYILSLIHFSKKKRLIEYIQECKENNIKSTINNTKGDIFDVYELYL